MLYLYSLMFIYPSFFWSTCISCKGKGKGHRITGHEGPEGEQMYSSTLPSTSALDEGWVVNATSGRFTLVKDSVPIL